MDPLALLLEAENDRKWFESRRREFEKKYKDMFVAVKNREVLAASADLQVIFKQVKARKIDPALVIVEFISAEGLTSIL